MPQWPTRRTSHQECFIGKVFLLEKKENGTKVWKEGEVKGGEGGGGQGKKGQLKGWREGGSWVRGSSKGMGWGREGKLREGEVKAGLHGHCLMLVSSLLSYFACFVFLSSPHTTFHTLVCQCCVDKCLEAGCCLVAKVTSLCIVEPGRELKVVEVIRGQCTTYLSAQIPSYSCP